MDMVKGLVEEVTQILHDPALQAKSQQRQRAERVERVADRCLDYQAMAQASLGDTWGTLKGAQRDEFVRLFRGLLRASYACRLDEFAKAKVAYGEEKNQGQTAQAPIVIQRPNDKIPVTFLLHQQSEAWKVYDLVIDGVSVVQNYRAEFARMIQGASYPALVKALEHRLKAECE
jgi:phospholipid transport system substrate-binding protein